MRISLLVAIDEGGIIGSGGRLPWHLRADLQRFRRLTMGHYLIMGRRTYESIGRPLPGRVSIILTRNPHWQPRGCPPTQCQVVASLAEALETARRNGETEVFVIGGAQVFQESLPLAGRIYLTRVHARVAGDVSFPDLRLEVWEEREHTELPADAENEYATTYSILHRRCPGADGSS